MVARVEPGGHQWEWGRPSGGAPHAVKACLYAGDCIVSCMLDGNTRIAPSKLAITPAPPGTDARLDGIVVLGSGNWGTPCARMQIAIRRSIASVCAEGWVLEPGIGGPLPVSP